MARKSLDEHVSAIEAAELAGKILTDVGSLKKDVRMLQKDMVIVREGISILLKRHG